jgi:hypothetical protein
MGFQQRRSPPPPFVLQQAAAAPFAPISWSTPIGPVYPVALRTFLQSPPLTLVGQDRIYGAPGQAPTYDWPLPKPPQFPIGLRTWLGGLNTTTLQPSTAVPFSQDDWPNPIAPLYPVALRTWLDPSKPWLSGQDTIYGAPGQVPAYDWPAPKRSVVPQGTWLLGLNTTTLVPSTAPPVVTTHWPLPIPPPYPITLRTWLDPSKTWLIGQDTIYGAPGQAPTYNWPLPRGPIYPVSLRTWLGGLNTTTLIPSTAPPFTPVEWRNPTRPPYPIALLTWLDPSKPWLAGQDRMYGGPGQVPSWDSPLPRGPQFPVALRTWLNDLVRTTLAPSIVPFHLTDWPLPGVPQYPVALRTFLKSSAIQLLGKDTLYGAPGQAPSYDWPLPRGPVFPMALRTWLSLYRDIPSGIVATADVIVLVASDAGIVLVSSDVGTVLIGPDPASAQVTSTDFIIVIPPDTGPVKT